jgi:hypothetical protein
VRLLNAKGSIAETNFTILAAAMPGLRLKCRRRPWVAIGSYDHEDRRTLRRSAD